MRVLISMVVSYLLGSIPFGYLIVSAKTGSDIRETGSGGTGATNVSRRAGKSAGVITLLLDALKGAAAVLIAKLLLADAGSATWWIAASGVLAMLGHIFPVWLGFRGGKGVATGVGVFAVLAPLPLVCAGVIFLVVVWLTRYVSLGSMTAAIAVPMFVWIEGSLKGTSKDLPTLMATLIGALLIVYAHRFNIRRLLSGTENKF